MKYSYGTNADQYLNKEGLEYLIEQLDIKYNGDSGTVDLTNYYDKAEIDNLLSNIDTGSGSTGNDGVGIQSVELVNYELIVTLTDDTVINLGNVRGEKGLQGIQGLDGAKGTDGINGTNGIDGKDGLDGSDGINGRGITSVVKTNTVGLVDTYTITYSDMTTSSFTVTNGKDGADGSGGSSGGGSSTDTYSTDEIAIGTWIDGKTIYRKVIDLTEYNARVCTEDHEMMYNFNHNISNIGTVIRTDLLYTDKDIYQEVNTNMKSTKISGSQVSSLATSVSNMTKWGSSIQINNTKILIKYGLNIGTTTGITNGILIVEYTKTE